MTIPVGWFATGKAPEDYSMELDSTSCHSGTRCAVIRAVKDPPRAFATLAQQFLPKDFLGKRVRLSSWIRTEEVGNWCGLWMRVDGPERTLAFDNMQSRPIRGTTSWTLHQIVLDVAENAKLSARTSPRPAAKSSRTNRAI